MENQGQQGGAPGVPAGVPAGVVPAGVTPAAAQGVAGTVVLDDQGGVILSAEDMAGLGEDVQKEIFGEMIEGLRGVEQSHPFRFFDIFGGTLRGKVILKKLDIMQCVRGERGSVGDVFSDFIDDEIKGLAKDQGRGFSMMNSALMEYQHKIRVFGGLGILEDVRDGKGGCAWTARTVTGADGKQTMVPFNDVEMARQRALLAKQMHIERECRNDLRAIQSRPGYTPEFDGQGQRVQNKEEKDVVRKWATKSVTKRVAAHLHPTLNGFAHVFMAACPSVADQMRTVSPSGWDWEILMCQWENLVNRLWTGAHEKEWVKGEKKVYAEWEEEEKARKGAAKKAAAKKVAKKAVKKGGGKTVQINRQ